MVEFGALQVEGTEISDLRNILPEYRFYGCDMRAGKGVDVILDMKNSAFKHLSIGTAICLDTLEHVEYPRESINEIHRCLTPSGCLILSSVFDFPIHSYPNDYWRFTPTAFYSLLQHFKNVNVFSFGHSPKSPRVVTAVAFKNENKMSPEFLKDCRDWERWHTAVVRALRGSE